MHKHSDSERVRHGEMTKLSQIIEALFISMVVSEYLAVTFL